MTDGDNGWQLFASTGKISDYLKYRENVFMVTDGSKTQEKERYERDLYGDGHGFVSNARG